MTKCTDVRLSNSEAVICIPDIMTLRCNLHCLKKRVHNPSRHLTELQNLIRMRITQHGTNY